MIYRLQRKFIIICVVSIFSVIALIWGGLLVLNIVSLNKNMDILADFVSGGGGKFPVLFDEQFAPEKRPHDADGNFNFITPETPFSTRHFSVFFDKSGEVSKTFTESIYSITEEQVIKYAKEVMEDGKKRGWVSVYRYKVFSTDFGEAVVFIDGSMNRSAIIQSMTIAGIVLVSCAVLVILLILLFSKKAVKPIAESYEKQKQFITDANHELKTPLTLILANVDIAESELGQNEWLDDIRDEGVRMTELVNQLVALSRMDEEKQALNITELSLGEMVADTVAEFEPLVIKTGKSMENKIDSTIKYPGDENLLRRLVGILMDNAIKYCDEEGEITVSLSRKSRHIVLKIENTYAAVGGVELHRLFDRFYRADSARTFTGGYGVGLSMAKAIVEKHKGEITSYKKENKIIGFKVKMLC